MKVTATGSPRICERRTVAPVWSFRAKSGTGSPTCTPRLGTGVTKEELESFAADAVAAGAAGFSLRRQAAGKRARSRTRPIGANFTVLLNRRKTPAISKLRDFKGERGPETLPIGAGLGRGRRHVHGLDEPHTLASKNEGHAALGVGPRGKRVVRIFQSDRLDERADERLSFVQDSKWHLPPGTRLQGIGIRDEFQRETQDPVESPLPRSVSCHERLGATRIDFLAGLSALVSRASSF